MRLALKCLNRILLFVVVTSFSSQGLALLNVGGKGSAEDRAELKLLYTFDDDESSNKIINQVHSNDLSHPSHLLIKGNRSNLIISDSSIKFSKNAILNNTDRKHIAAKIWDDVGSSKKPIIVSLESKKAIGRRVLQDGVYLESQGKVDFIDLCSSNEEATLQVFFKPKNVNYGPLTANIFRLQPLTATHGTITLSQQFNEKRLRAYVNEKAAAFRVNDLEFTGVQNESVVTFSPSTGIDGYFLLHSGAGKEGWESVNTTAGGKVLKNYANSRVLLGTAPIKNGAGASNLVNQLNALNDDASVKAIIQGNTGGYVGSIEQIAFYCRFVDQAEVLGGEYTDTTKIKVTPNLNGEPTQAEKVAVRLLSLMAKKKIPVDAALVKKAALHISRGEYKKAAQVGVELPDFYNNTVKDLGLRMSNREETIDAPLNDFAATMIGVVRDQVNAKELLTGNFYYRGNGLVGVPSDMKTHMLHSNIHYQELEKGGYDLKKALVRADGQKITGPQGTPVNHPDPAGVLTSRAYMAAHAVAGTNRRQVEYAFKQFMCLDLSEIADTEASDLRVGRDIDRFPGNSHKKYQTSCKGCHTVMDGFRGAFAKTDFGTYVKHGDLVTVHKGRYPKKVSFKVNHNEFAYPNGYITRDDSFYNFANRGANKVLLGWRSPVSKGYGMGQFGKMLAESKRFSKCMVKRVFEAVCPVNIDENILSKLSVYVSEFESSNYNLKELFINASISPLCLGGN